MAQNFNVAHSEDETKHISKWIIDFAFFFAKSVSKSKKNVRLPLKKVTKKKSFFTKKKRWKYRYLGGKFMFFFSNFENISRSKIKKRIFYGFFESKFELYGSNWTQKNDPKNHLRKEFKGEKVGGGRSYYGQIGRNWFRKKIDFFFNWKNVPISRKKILFPFLWFFPIVRFSESTVLRRLTHSSLPAVANINQMDIIFKI